MNHISNPQESIEKAIQFLETYGIPFERHDHAAVFTVDEVSELVSIEKGIRTKNLFVRDKKGRQHVLNNYSFDLYGERWDNLFKHVKEDLGSWDTRKGYKTWHLNEVK